MSVCLEIVVPVRNPGSKLIETGASLVAQTGRDFSVLLSDNFSTSGSGIIAQFCDQLRNAGITARAVKPPFELGRVQHWNWAHAQAKAEWLKPLFVGDRLKTAYVQRVRERLGTRPAAQFMRCDCEFHTAAGIAITPAPFTAESLTPTEFLAYFPALGNWLGGPINFAYRRAAWQAAGGFATQFPASADYKLSALLALRHGIEVFHEPLTEFHLHEQRFSSGIRGRRVNGCMEVWLILRQMRNYCLSVGLPWPEGGVRRGVFRQLGIDYWSPFKQRLKEQLSRS